MAKFFPRNPTYNANNIALPSNTQSRVWYGYRSSFFVIDGSLYHSANNTAVLNGYQIGNTGWDFANSSVATIDVDGIFEPSLFANPFDLTGSRLSSEYTVGRYNPVGTHYSSNNQTWSFKNCTAFTTSNVAVSTANSLIISTGTFNRATDRDTGLNVTTVQSTLNATFFSNNTLIGQWFIPAANGQPFIPHTFGAWVVNTTGITTTAQLQITERRFGDTNATFSFANNMPVGTFTTTNSVFLGAYSDNLQSVATPNLQANWPISGGLIATAANNTFIPAMTTVNQLFMGDQIMFGTSNTNHMQFTSSGRAVGVSGPKPIPTAPNASETGARVLAHYGNPFVFYYYYNSTNGGIQGVDTSTSTAVRLQIKSLNTATNTYTTSASIKKGVSGIIIPSQPITSSPTEHSFYNIVFNGADVQTIGVQRVNLNGTAGSYAVVPYTLTMTTEQQQTLYADLGHANTHASQFDQPGFRRQTVQRVWYSVSSTNVRRLHLGIYNTDGCGVVTGSNQFNDPLSRGRMFKIYSWTLNDSTPSATYLGSADTSSCAPRYFYPMDNNWTIMYLGGVLSNDQIFALNDTTGLYAYQSTMSYKAARLFKDKEGRQAAHVLDMANTSGGMISNYMDIITAEVGQQLVITSQNTSFTYTGTTITSNVAVDVYDYIGNRLSKNVAITIVGPTSTPGITFNDNSYATTITTSNSASTNVGIKVISSVGAKILGTVIESA